MNIERETALIQSALSGDSKSLTELLSEVKIASSIYLYECWEISLMRRMPRRRYY